jgi:soluble lytic murein transglycosylase-like protein
MKKIIIVVLFFTSFSLFANQNVLNVPRDYTTHVRQLCQDNNLPYEIVYRLIEWESYWNPLITVSNNNGTEDIGLMQLNSKYIEDFQFRYNNNVSFTPKDWYKNAEIGIKHLAFLKEITGSMFGAIAAYNMGLTAYRQWRSHERSMPEPTMKELEYVFRF